MEELEHWHSWGHCKILQPIGKQFVSVLKNVIVQLLFNPAILLLRVFLSEIKIYVYTKICTQMFIAAFFKITIERTQISISWSMYKQNMTYVLV